MSQSKLFGKLGKLRAGPLLSQKTRNILGVVVLVLAFVVAALVITNTQARARQDAEVEDLVSGLAQAETGDLLLRRQPDQFADQVTPELLALLRQGQPRLQALYEAGEIQVAVTEMGQPVRQEVDPGEGKALYRVDMTLDVKAHPTFAPGPHPAHVSVLLHQTDGGWKASQITTVIEK